MRKILLATYLSLMMCSVYGEPVGDNSTNNWINLNEIKDVNALHKTLSEVKNGTIYQSINGEKAVCGKIVDGFISGELITYYKDGKRKCVGNCVKNKPEGKWVFYYENGKKQLEGGFKNGKKEGKWIYYNQEGKTEKTEMYKDNKLVENK